MANLGNENGGELIRKACSKIMATGEEKRHQATII
jgi:hypothetical protein